MTADQTALLQRLTRFLIVGGVAFLVYLAVMWAVVDRMGQGVTLGAAAAFIVATVVSYAGNALWSFQAPVNKGTAGRFLVVVLLGLAANIAIAAVLGRVGAGYAVISLVVFVTVPILNFLGHQFWTFRTGRPAGQSG